MKQCKSCKSESQGLTDVGEIFCTTCGEVFGSYEFANQTEEILILNSVGLYTICKHVAIHEDLLLNNYFRVIRLFDNLIHSPRSFK